MVSPKSVPVRAGRPREFEPEVAVAACMDVFWRAGYAATSVPQLSEAAAVSTSSIYNTFGSKRDVYLAALDRYLDLAREHMYGPMLHGELGTVDIDAFLDRLLISAATSGQHGCLVTKATAEFGDADEAVVARTTAFRRELRTALAAALERARALGELDGNPLPVGVLADLLLGQVYAFNLLDGAGAPRGELEALDSAARALLHPPAA